MSGEKVAYSPPPPPRRTTTDVVAEVAGDIAKSSANAVGAAAAHAARGSVRAAGAVASTGFTVSGAAARAVNHAVKKEIEAAKQRAEARERERRRQEQAHWGTARKEEEEAAESDKSEQAYTSLLKELQSGRKVATQAGGTEYEALLKRCSLLANLYPKIDGLEELRSSLEQNRKNFAASPPLRKAAAVRLDNCEKNIQRVLAESKQRHIRHALAEKMDAWLTLRGYQCLTPFKGLDSDRGEARYRLPGGGASARVTILADGRLAFRVDPEVRESGAKLTQEQGRHFQKVEKTHCKAFPEMLNSLQADGYKFKTWESFEIPLEQSSTVVNESPENLRQPAPQRRTVQKQKRYL